MINKIIVINIFINKVLISLYFIYDCSSLFYNFFNSPFNNFKCFSHTLRINKLLLLPKLELSNSVSIECRMGNQIKRKYLYPYLVNNKTKRVKYFHSALFVSPTLQFFLQICRNNFWAKISKNLLL